MSICTSSLSSVFRADLSPCRICLGNDIKDLSNPIISPCKCKGSMGNIHLNCLKDWIKQKINIQIKPYVITVNWNSFSCELCHSPYPFAVYFDGIIYELLDVPYPKPPFIVLEGVTDKNLDSGVVFIVSFGKLQKIFELGRASCRE